MMKLNDEFILSLLSGIDIFEKVDPKELMELSHLFKERIFGTGEVIFVEDSIGSSMMIIASGEVRISQRTGSNAEEALVIIKKGDVFGEMTLMEDLPRSASVIAHTDVITLEIERDDLVNFMERYPRAGVQILLKLGRILSSRLRETDIKLKAFVNLAQWV